MPVPLLLLLLLILLLFCQFSVSTQGHLLRRRQSSAVCHTPRHLASARQARVSVPGEERTRPRPCCTASARVPRGGV